MSLLKPATFRSAGVYAAVICGGYAIDLGCYVVLVESGVHIYTAYLASFVVGATCNVILLRHYLAAGRYSFHNDLALTLTTNGALILVAMGLYIALMKLLDVPHLAAKILANGLSFMVNYITRRRYF